METLSQEEIRAAVRLALAEDIGSGDATTMAIVPPGVVARASVRAREPLVVAGLAIAEAAFREVSPDLEIAMVSRDGQRVAAGDELLKISGPAAPILSAERVALNYLQRLSGIATLTAQFVHAVSGTGARILDTRKTTPGLRRLEKYSVVCGGGTNHRFGLFDMIMLKDNHIDYCGGIARALDRAYEYVKKYKPSLRIEIEARTLDDVREVLKSGKADRIMLDNFGVSLLSEALQMIGKKIETEASGGINLDNIREYAATGVDYISIGALIHQARSLDRSLKAV